MIKSFKSCFLISVFISVFNLHSYAQKQWDLIKQEDGITIYSKTTADSDFKSFRAEMQLDESIHAFVALLKDLKNMPEWAYSVKYTDVLEISGDSTQIYYAEASVPFPFKNRDGIYLNRFRWIPDSSKLVVDIKLLPDYLDEKDNLVRVKGEGFWSATITDTQMLNITFQMQVDPGGSIPAWLTNIFLDDTPYSTLTKLRAVIKKAKYQNIKYDFIE